ncbi:phage tail protein [Sphingobacterium multivorum]|uniref:phage tail protein n=1 Tax=Sphingobacterium multivorum TaxID=28454 RepID=UPI0028AE9074|nr:hypothetical protein [Sphingobacterium multivorum]
MERIKVYRKNIEVASLPLLAGTFSKRLMAEHQLVFTFTTITPIELQIGDTLTYKGEIMTMNQIPEVKRNNKLEYTFIFEGVRHSLSRYLIKDEGSYIINYSDTLESYMFMFLESLNSNDSGWTLGDLEEVEPFTLTFDKVDHLTALNMIAEACKCEWQLKKKVISIKKTVGQFRNYPLSYGKDNGLYSITRKKIENAKIVTRALAVGGTNNLPLGYPYTQLTLSGFVEDQDAIDRYGVREGIIEDSEIFPRLKDATVKEANKVSDNIYSIATDLDFDLNGQFINGQDATIVFKSGMLTDQKFKILSYNNTTKTIRYEAIKTANGDLLPSGASVASVGDKYILLGIRMPQSYINAALQELTEKRLEFLNSNKVPRVVYEAPLDPLDLKRNNVEIEEGDILPFLDTKIGLDDNLRVTYVKYPACFPDFLPQGMVFTAEIGQEVTYNRAQKVDRDIKETRQVITQSTRQSIEEDRLLAMRMRQLQDLVFDADGYFDGSRIKPNSIETLMLSVGAKSQNFLLNGVGIYVNNNDDPHKLKISGGQLVHLEVRIEGLGYIWNMAELSKNDLISGKPYYVSARCSRTALSGTWYVSETPMTTESENGYYHFNVGVIYSEFEGRRDYSFTSGMTYINGAQITTGQIDAARLNVEEIVVNGGGATVSQMNDAKQQAIAAANAYSEANDELLQIVAESYADGLVSAEEQARINDATQKLLEAKQHADTTANAALQSAKGYTDSLISSLGELAHEDLVELAKLGSTIIQGGYIKAELIDVIKLFAQDIQATNLKVTGDSFVGQFKINSSALIGDGEELAGLRSIKDGNEEVWSLGRPYSAASAYVDFLGVLQSSSSRYKSVGLRVDITGGTSENTALDIVNGDIKVKGKKGYTGKITLANTASSTTYYHFNYINGLVVDFQASGSSINPF